MNLSVIMCEYMFLRIIKILNTVLITCMVIAYNHIYD